MSLEMLYKINNNRKTFHVWPVGRRRKHDMINHLCLEFLKTAAQWYF